MAKKTYHCDDCGGDITVEATAPAPECCGKSMAEVLDNCTKAHDAEQSRLGDADDACDDAVR